LEIYELVDSTYQLQMSELFWMPEVGLVLAVVNYHLDALMRDGVGLIRSGDRCLSEAEILRERVQF
jgi:hypothetical protein